MNENQECNYHRLHIEPCLCGNPSPVVMGDDFDADVSCDTCGRITPVCYGTRGAILYWNARNEVTFMGETEDYQI